jgi:hypothetical protein
MRTSFQTAISEHFQDYFFCPVHHLPVRRKTAASIREGAGLSNHKRLKSACGWFVRD